MKPIVVLLAITSLFLQSCSSLKPITDEARSNTSLENLSELNGNFRMTPTDCYRDLPYALTQNRLKNQSLEEDSIWVNLKVIDDSRILVTTFANGEIIEEKLRRGKFKDGFFHFGVHYKIPYFYFLFNVLSDQVTRVSLTPNGDLYVDTGGAGCGFILIVPFMCSGDELYGLLYKRINNPETIEQR